MATFSSLESLILQLLVPNNEALSQGFNAMREAFKDPVIIPSLCECMRCSQNPQVRQYAAVLLRKKLAKSKQWKRIPPHIKQGVKQSVLQLFREEAEPSVLKSVTELIGSMAKHELVSSNWMELMQLLNQYICSNDAKEKELGLYAMSIITASAGDNLKPYLKGLLSLFSKCLLDRSTINIPFHTIECLTNLVSCIGTEEMNQFQNMILPVLEVIKHLAITDEDKACKAMEIFDELIECEVALIVPHIKPVISFCLQIASTQNLKPSIRVKSLSIIRWIIQLKKKTILKHKLISPILSVLFPIMCDHFLNEEMAIDDEDYDKDCPVSSAGQVIDVMALHLPPEKLIPPLMQHLDVVLKSCDPNHRKAAYLALSVIAEGCSEYIRNKGLKTYLEVICNGIQDQSSIVRNPAFYCLQQFAEYLQPDINKYAPEILPLLLQYFDEVCQLADQKEKVPLSLKFTFYALETFCEGLGEDLLPYLQPIMERLLSFLSNIKSLAAKEMTISAIGSVASAAKESFVPYFSAVIDCLKEFITDKTKNLSLKVQAIDTLSVLAQSVGSDTFRPMARDCMVLGLQLVDQIDDPDVRRCMYTLFSAVSTVLKNEILEFLGVITDHMISSMRSTEGINTHYATDDNTTFSLLEEENESINGDEESIGEEDEDDEDEIAGFSVENAYMEEKESACLALKQIASNTGSAFVPYVIKSFDEVKKLLECPDSDVRKEAILCLGQFCITVNDAYNETKSLEFRLILEQKINIFLPKLFAISREDTERQVVLACLETLEEMASNLKENFLNRNVLELIVTLIKDVFNHKLACQDDDDDDELDGEEAEYDMMLYQYAGNILPVLMKSVPSKQIMPHFESLLKFLIPKTKKSCTIADRSFSVGTLAEAISFMEPGYAQPYISRLCPVFLKGMTDEDGEVRSNAVFGLGVLVQNVTKDLYNDYPALLQSLSNMLAKEDNPRAKDNLCSTLAKMIIVNHSAVPLKEVFPAFLQCLPLQVDMDENLSVYQCLSLLHGIHCEEFFLNVPDILRILSVTSATQKVDSETCAVIVKLVKDLHSECSSDFESIVSSLPSDGVEALRKALAC